MIKMKKSAALILAGVLACSMPMPVMASSDTEVVESLLAVSYTHLDVYKRQEMNH